MSKYKAFISYTHHSEMPLAVVLDKALTRFAKPWNRLRAMRLYRDVESQALTPDLLSAVEGAMENSEFLILLASPAAAASPWVPLEVAHWLETSSVEKLIIVVCDGEIEFDKDQGDFDWDKTNCLPHTLKGVYQSAPLYLDMRWARGAEEELNLDHPQFKDNVARLSASLNGMSKEDMLSEEVTQFRRTARIRNAAIATLSVLLVATAVAATIAVHQRNQAIQRSLQIQVKSELDNNRLGHAVQIARAANERFGDGPMTRDMSWQVVSHPSAVVHEFKDLNAHFAQFSPDGTRLMTGVYKAEGGVDIRIQDRLGGNEHRFEDVGPAIFHPDGTKVLVPYPDSRRLISVSTDMEGDESVESECLVPSVDVYDLETEWFSEWEGEWRGEQAQVCGDFVRIFDKDAQHIRDVWAPGAQNVSISADGQRIAVGDPDFGVSVLDIDGNILTELPGEYPVISPDGSMIATVFPSYMNQRGLTATGDLHCTREDTILDYEGPFGEDPPGMISDETCEPGELLRKLAIRGSTMVFTSDGEELAFFPGTHPVFAFGGIVTLKDVEIFDNWEKQPHWYELKADEDSRKVIELQGFEVTVSPDGNWLASGERLGRTTWIWHRSGRFHAEVDGGMPVWMPGQPMLMTHLWGQVRIWDIERLRFGSRALLANVIGLEEEALGVPPDFMDFHAKKAFWRGCDPECDLDFDYIDAIDVIETAQMADPECDAGAAHYRENLMLSICRADGSWRLYDLESEAPDVAVTSAEHGPGLEELGFSPDARQVISIDNEGTAKLWDISNGTVATDPIEFVLGEENYAYKFSPDSKMLAMVPHRGVARVWNTEGILLASLPLRDSRENYNGLRFFNDGKHLVFSGTDSGHVAFYTLWKTDVEALYDGFNWVPKISSDDLTP